MKHVLYIGIYSEGSTSKMRADKIKRLYPDWDVTVIDTDVPTKEMSHIWQSLGFRYKIGPLIKRVNAYILEHLKLPHYNLIWVDKAIYITRETTAILRESADKLVHFTPDPAFTFHRSKHFYASMPLYDFMITTKSYEIEDFARVMGSKDKVLYATQGFDKNLHRPLVAWKQKNGVAFIGHYEEERVQPIEAILDAGIDVTLAGIKWEKFVRSHACPNLHYLGAGVFGEDYVKAISSCLFAWGSVSKWIPEKHTTRTFEIPACKTALLTERNEELEGFFSDNEVIFYNDTDDMVTKIKYFIDNLEELKVLIENGYNRVQTRGFDYEEIMKQLIHKIIK